MADDVTPKRSRRVDSGTWPLYVLQLCALLVSSVIQVAQWRVPASVADSTPEWYDTWFLIVQPVGALTVLIALFAVRQLIPSLQLERVGCTVNASIGLTYVTAVCTKNGGPPAAGATWLVAAFALYSAYRIHEINKAFGLDLLHPTRQGEP